jgi:hypothetical protein
VTVTTFASAVNDPGGEATGTIERPPPSTALAADGATIVRVVGAFCDMVSTLGRSSVGDDIGLEED